MAMMKKFSLFLFCALFFCSVAANAQMIRVKYKCIEKNRSVQQIMFNFSIKNEFGGPVELSDLKLRYYYTKESPSREEFHVEYASIGSSNVEGQFFPGYVEISFKKDSGVIPNNGDSGEIQVRINMSDWMVYDQGNDYSFDPSKTEYDEFVKIALFWKDQKLWGAETAQMISDARPSPNP